VPSLQDEFAEDLTASARAVMPGARVFMRSGRFWLEDAGALRDLGSDRCEATAQLAEHLELLLCSLFTNPVEGSMCSECGHLTYCYAYTDKGKVPRCGDCWWLAIQASRHTRTQVQGR